MLPALPRPEVSPSCTPPPRLGPVARRSCVRLQETYALLATNVNIDRLILHFSSSARYCPGMAIATERRQFAVVDPADESLIESLDSARPEDGIAAVDAAEAAAADWAARAPRDRAEILRQAFDLMTARTDEVAHLIVR